MVKGFMIGTDDKGEFYFKAAEREDWDSGDYEEGNCCFLERRHLKPLVQTMLGVIIGVVQDSMD
jgi:hypothetical protein